MFENQFMLLIGLLGVVIVLLVILLVKRPKLASGEGKEQEILQNLATLQTSLQNQVEQNRADKSELDNKNETLMLQQQNSLGSLQALSQNLYQTYQEMMRQFQVINGRTLTSAQMLENVENNISGMNDIMVNKKARGNWGEYQLNTLLSVYAGDSQEIFETQYPLKNGYIGDVALHLPENKKVLMIDSKFPMENYQNLINSELTETELAKYTSMFKQNIKKHINDISKKYITNETVDFAVMFIPSEAIYTYICSENSDLIEYGHSKHVLMTSPTTLLGVVFTLVNATKDYNRSRHVKEIEKTIVKMSNDTRRLVERLEKVQTASDNLQKSLKDATISSDKINMTVQKIASGYVEGSVE